MNKTIIYLILIIAFFYDKVFQLGITFSFGYCFDYFIFEVLRKKTQKEEIEDFFLAYNQKYGKQGRRH